MRNNHTGGEQINGVDLPSAIARIEALEAQTASFNRNEMRNLFACFALIVFAQRCDPSEAAPRAFQYADAMVREMAS
jgi:hypothetical protein